MSNCEKQMYKKAGLTLAFFIILTITYLFLIGTLDLRGSYFTPFLQSLPTEAPNYVPPCRSLSPLRVYMYDLPQRFNVGMLRRRSSDETPVTVETLPPWPAVSGLRRQHSVEYWMMASLLVKGEERENEGEGGNGVWVGEERESEVVRVLDPEMADVFFVPFFSSLSFNVYGHNMTDPSTERDKQLQVDILKYLRESKYWQRSEGRDHVIPMHHPNAFRFLREQVNASILIVADFGRYSKSMSNLKKDVVAPYVHVVDSYTDDDTPNPFKSRTTLLYFRGRTVRKDEGVVRAKLQKLLEGYDDVHFERSFASEESIRLSTQGMRKSKFCLHPAGDTPSSCRLFDAIVSHCVPVIVSDQIELPYEDELDYSEFSLFFSTTEAIEPGYMIEKLRQFPEEKWLKMWNKLKNISHHYEFQYPPKNGDAVNMLWRQVRHKLPFAKLTAHRTRRLKIPDWWGRRR
ncbi:probable arabinosyltransferase ARAD1 [Chenopodium quinoa]|uniref:Exostosin GT47 domain-containing protein n=1 Tax=Chenopodium quinoa TaxID=63459 RepID=A0A803L169_CHEQI|nr:probable arabinosyltransferase ARAD1 [Chenopodium quinoa]